MDLLRRCRLASMVGGVALACLAGSVVASAPAAQAFIPRPVAARYEAVSWGENNLGQLGNGIGELNSPVWGQVSGMGSGVAQVAAGTDHGLALMTNGTVWAWGDNAWGELGDGTTNSYVVPVQVTGLTNVTQVAAGVGFSLALRSDGTVWAWGDNRYGQLGDGTTNEIQPTPVLVYGLTGVTNISAGDGFALALRSDGTVWAWGNNVYGQLGDGSTIDSLVPTQVIGLYDVTRISAGEDASLATSTQLLTATTTVWAWGNNNLGQLGDGTLAIHTLPEPVAGIGAPGIAGISAGDLYATVLGSDGSVWGWGYNWFATLGSPPSIDAVTQPVQILGPGSGITQLSAGGDHVLALTSNGTVLAWGRNSSGELGDGTTTDSPAPVQVAGLGYVSQVSAGLRFSLAVHAVPLTICCF